MKLEKNQSLPKDECVLFCKLYEKFIEAETARNEYLEFCKYFEVLEKCKILPTTLHGKGEVGSSSEHSGRSQEDTKKSDTNGVMGIISSQNQSDKTMKNLSSLI